MPDRNPGSKDLTPMPDAERAQWELLFRDNIRHLPSTAEKWFSLRNIGKELIEQEGAAAILERLKRGENLDSSFQPSQNYIDYVAQMANDMNGLISAGSSLKVPEFVEDKLKEAGQKFGGNEAELKRIRSRLFWGRGSAQAYLVEKGPFRQLPTGNKLRSLAVLSAGVDYMRGDIEYGYLTDYSKAIAECFGYAQMQLLQHRAVQKLFGGRAQLVFRDTGRPVPRLSVPQDKEIAELQRRVVNRLQRIM